MDIISVCPGHAPATHRMGEAYVDVNRGDHIERVYELVPLTLNEVIRQRVAAVEATRDRLLVASWTYPGRGAPTVIPPITMAAGPSNQLDWSGLAATCLAAVAAGDGGMPVGIEPDDGVIGSIITLTAADALVVLRGFSASRLAIRGAAVSLAQALAAAADIETALAIDIDSILTRSKF